MNPDTLTSKHPKALEFKEALTGEKGCNFRKNEEGKIIWDCAGHEVPERHALSTALLTEMGGFDIAATLKHFDTRGGYCDCEVIFNVLWMVKRAQPPTPLKEVRQWVKGLSQGHSLGLSEHLDKLPVRPQGCASWETLLLRYSYGGRKGRRAERLLILARRRRA